MNQPMRNDRIARFTELIEREASTLEELCQRITEGQTLTEACKEWDVPYSRMASWLEVDAGRWEAYLRALRLRADALVAEGIAISDGGKVEVIEHTRKDGTVVEVPVLPDHQRDRLRFEARLKVAARWDRVRFGAEGEAPAKAAKPMGDVLLLEVARRQAWVFEKAKRIVEAQRQPREPRLLEAKAEVVAEPVVDPYEGEI